MISLKTPFKVEMKLSRLILANNHLKGKSFNN